MSEAAEVQELILPDGFGLDEVGDWIAWGGRHAGEVDDVISAATEWAAVPFTPIRPKWTATKTAGDTLVAVIEDAPPFVQSMTVGTTREQLVAQAASLGVLAVRLIKALPHIRALAKILAGG